MSDYQLGPPLKKNPYTRTTYLQTRKNKMSSNFLFGVYYWFLKLILLLSHLAACSELTHICSHYSCNGVLKLTEISIFSVCENKSHPQEGKSFRHHLALFYKSVNVFLDWLSENKWTNPRFCLAGTHGTLSFFENGEFWLNLCVPWLQCLLYF